MTSSKPILFYCSAVFLGVSLIRPSAPLWSRGGGGHLQQLGQPGSLTTVSASRSALCCEPALGAGRTLICSIRQFLWCKHSSAET